MRTQSLRRMIAVMLAMALLCSLVYTPGQRKAKAVTESGETVQELLGENWYVHYNGGMEADTEYLSIVQGGSDGEYALRIGHATAATNLCLRYDLYKTDIGLAATEALAIGMKFSAKVEGGFADGSWIGVINPVENAGGGNRNNLTEADMASIGADWTAIDKDDEYFGVWSGGEYDRAILEFNIVLDAGDYFYLDDLQGYGYWGNTGDMAYVNVVHNGSFEPENGEPETTAPETTEPDATEPETTEPETTEPEEPEVQWDAVQKKLGENWYVYWSSGNAEPAEYLTVTEGGSHGNYSLRIGHPTEATDICLRYNVYKSDLGFAAAEEMGIGMKFSAKVEGVLAEGSWIGVINPVAPATGGNRANLTDDELASIGTDWTAIDKGSEYGVWCGAEYDRAELEFNIVLEPGNYFYLDALQGYGYYGNTGDMAYVNVVHNGSFERWYCAWNASEATTQASDFAQIVEGGRSGNALRLGNADMATDYTLHLQLPAALSDGYSFDLWAKTQGPVTYASFELYNGNLQGAVRRYSLADIGTEWTHVAHAYDVTDVWVDSGTLLVQLYVNLPAGSYLYLDDIHIIKGLNGVYSADASNMLFDGGFRGEPLSFGGGEVPPETTEPEITEPETTEPEATEPESTGPETTEPETTQPAAEPEQAAFVGGHKSAEGWYVSWNSHDEYRSDYLTAQSYSGSYALALTAPETDMSHTLAQKVTGLTEGVEYTFEGYFKKIGDFSAVSIMMGSTFLQLKDWQMEDWTLCTGSFTAGTASEFSIFTVCPQGGLLLADELKLYRTDDPEQTNLLANGGFEVTVGDASEMLKLDKAFAQAPVSVEAVLRLPVGAEKGGVILGNLAQTGCNVGINGQGQPYVYGVLPDGTETEVVFDAVDVRTGETLTLAVTLENGTLKCIVNGEEKQALAAAFPDDAALYEEAFAIAGDNTDGNENYFTGDLIRVSVSSAQGLMAAWELENTENPERIADSTGNGYDALRYGEFFSTLQSAVTEEYPYAFAVVGDTQYTNRGDTQGIISGADYMGQIYQWIIDNKDVYNIQAVLGMGDIVDTSPSTLDESAMTQSLKEWAHAVESIGKLNAAGIPYTLVKGNHDSIAEYPENDTSVFESSLKALGYDTQVDGWYEAGGTLANSYITLTVGSTKWLILTLDYNHSEAEIAWAEKAIEDHADHKVIVTTHAYLNNNGQWLDTSDRCELVGQDLWEMLIGKHENIELVLSGHIHSSDVVVRQLQGAGDNVVTEMLIDSQSLDRDDYLAAGKSPYAMVTLLLFSEDGEAVKVANYATGKEKFYHADAIKTLDLSDGQAVAEPPITPPLTVELQDTEIPGWVTRWNGNESVNYRYLTTCAHSGEYALALTGTENAMAYTYGQLLRKLEVGEEYTFEGYVLYSGKFTMLDLMLSGNANKLSLKSFPAEQWNKVTMTFVAEETTVPMEIFGDGRAKAIVLLDDVTVYKTSDAEKTNIVENPGFEVIEATQTEAPEKTYDYPTDWEIWAENDDRSQLFVTDVAQEGSNGFAFVNTAKHASSLTQYVTGLKDGSYVLSAYVRSSGGQEDAALLAKGYDKENPAGQAGAKITKSGIWTRVELEFEVTSGQVQVSLWNAGNAGNWIIVDQVELLAKNDTTYTNLLKNGSFETAENGEPPIPTEPPTEPAGPTEPTEPPMEVALTDTEIPGWVTRWNGNEGVNYRYLTTRANSGKYALALTGTESPISYTYGQLLRKLEVGKEYTFEGYVLYSGEFTMLDLLVSGTTNRLSLKEIPEEQWTKVTLSFVAEDSTVPVEIFCDAPAGAIVLLDDVTVYKTSDESKTNLIENPGFEVIEEPQTAAPEKTYDYPVSWDVWAENDDNSQLFVTDTARDGSNGFAFVNTAKHASSLTQYVTGLKDGSYVLSAYVRSSGGQEDAALLAKGYDKENPAGQAGAKITKSGIWTRVELEFEVTSGQVQVSLWNAGNAGNWIIVDQVELLAKNDTTYTNLLKNGSFETAENGEPPIPTEPPAGPTEPTEPPMEVELQDTEIPGWVTRWNGNEGVNYRYLTTHAYSGKYALALTGTESAMAYTYGQLLRKLEAGKAYTFEGYVLYSGQFQQLDLLVSGTANRLSLKEVPEEQWTKVTFSFVAEDSTVPVEIFCDAPAGAIVLLDDVTVYKTEDTEKANLMENPGFEAVEATQTEAPGKTYDYPTGWEVWAENDDKTQLFVTDVAREGSNGFAFVNTAKHASSLTQYVTGLKDGSYVLSAYVRSSGGQEDAALLVKGYDKENPAGQAGAKITKSGIWTRVELEFEVTSGQVQVSLWNAGNAGNWIIIDQVELLAKNDTTYTNLLKNGGFEEAESELPPQTPIQVELIDREIPGWIEAWNQNPGTNYRYLTTHANSGSYALALVSKSGSIGYTFAQRLELLPGVSYTLEGYVYKSGELDAADILIGPNGVDGKISLAEERMDGYQKVTVTFRPSSDYLEIGAYVSGPQGSLLMLDDLVLYRNGDSQNLLTNGDFETLETAQTQPPVKAEELPQGWEIWAEDDDVSLVYVAGGGRNGYAMGFNNTKKQAASLTQTVTGLEDGVYVLTAWVKSSGGQNDAAMLLKGYDREDPNGQSGVQIPKTGIWVQLRLEVEVTSGQVLVSFWNDANEGNWLMVDSVSLYRKSDETKTNLLINGEFEDVLKASGGELPPAGELNGTEPAPAPAPEPDDTQGQEAPDSTAWIGFVLGTVLILAVIAVPVIVIILKKRKK